MARPPLDLTGIPNILKEALECLLNRRSHWVQRCSSSVWDLTCRADDQGGGAPTGKI